MNVEASSKVRVLLVDDSETFLRAALRLMRVEYAQELEVIATARNGDDALRAAGELQPDLVLLDINMPGTNGIELIPLLRARLPHVPIIMLTLLERSTHEREALAAGADGYVVKNQMDEQLLPAIRRVRA